MQGLEKYFIEIEEWLQNKPVTDTENKPLLIDISDDELAKTIIVQWMESRDKLKKEQNYPDIMIAHFAGAGGNNSNYFYMIHRILIKLREIFNIKQKVELVEEKLRRSFSYWLDVCQQRIEKSIVYDGQVIIVIEGLHNFIEFGSKLESEIKFWLPKFFPKRFRVIVTSDSSKNCYNYLKKHGSPQIKIDQGSLLVEDIMHTLQQKEFMTSEEYSHNFFKLLSEQNSKNLLDRSSIKALAASFCPWETPDILSKSMVDLTAMRRILSKLKLEELFQEAENYEVTIWLVIKYFEDKITTKQKYIDVMMLLSLTFKGTTLQELMNMTKITEQEWNLMLAFFKSYFFTFHGLWSISNDIFKKVLHDCYIKNEENPTKLINDYHIRIGKELEKTPVSIRRLEEQTIHYFLANEHFLLKQTISDIENFLLLFNPYTKYDLCRYWQKLEDFGYDPVIEFNKRIESFNLHYEPRPEELFTVILQVSRFFKEFADFETKKTPVFRHPSIRGKKLHQNNRGDDEDSTYLEKDKDNRIDIFHFLMKDKIHKGTQAAVKAVQSEMREESSLRLNEQSAATISLRESSLNNGQQMSCMVFRSLEDDDEVLDDDKRQLEEELQMRRQGVVEFLQDIGLKNEIERMQMTEENCRPAVVGHEALNIEIPQSKVERF